jgi:uncharacterized Tic20 family protein
MSDVPPSEPPQEPVPPGPPPPTPPPLPQAPTVNYQGPTGAAYPAPYMGPPPTQDDKTMAMLAHLLGIFTGFIGPLIIWLIKKDQSPYVNDQGKEALNFQLTMLIIHLALIPTCFCWPVLLVGQLAAHAVRIIFAIIAAVKSHGGEAYRHPICFRMVR